MAPGMLGLILNLLNSMVYFGKCHLSHLPVFIPAISNIVTEGDESEESGQLI